MTKIREMDLESRLRASVSAAAAPSLVPDFNAPPPEKEVETVPELQEVITSPAIRLRVIRLTTQHVLLGAAESEAKKEKEKVTAQLKKILGEYKVGKCMVDGNRVNYFNSPRSSLSRDLLLAHNVSPATLTACTVKKDSYTLKITAAGEKENGDD